MAFNGFRSLNYLLKNCEKPAQQIDSRGVAHLAHHLLLRTLIQSMILQSVRRVHQGHTKLSARSPGKLAFCRGQWDASYTKTFSESAWRNDFSMVGNPTQHHWSSKWHGSTGYLYWRVHRSRGIGLWLVLLNMYAVIGRSFRWS